MTYAAGANAGASAGAAIANAVKASGAIVQVESEDFSVILGKVKNPLVVCAQGGLFSTKYQYLTSYKGLFFYAKTSEPLDFPRGTETIQAKKIWTPGG